MIRGLAAMAVWAAVVLLGRRAILEGMRAFRDDIMGRPVDLWSPVLWLVAALVVGSAAVALDRAARPWARAIGLALGIAVVGWGAQQRYDAYMAGPFVWTYTPDRQLGRFPSEPGPTTTRVPGRDAPALILPDGSRECFSPEGDRVVAFVGDSFTFGKGVPDEATTCALVAEQLGPTYPGWRFINLGQPGANGFSVVDTARFAVEAHGAEVLLVELLLHDDARAIDVNTFRRLVRAPWYRLLASVFEHEVLLDFLMLLPEAFDADFYTSWVSRDFLERAVALHDASGVPMVLMINTPPDFDGEPGRLGELARALAASRPAFSVVDTGPVIPPDGDFAVIPGDGHPTPGANLVRAAWMAEHIAQAIEAR